MVVPVNLISESEQFAKIYPTKKDIVRILRIYAHLKKIGFKQTLYPQGVNDLTIYFPMIRNFKRLYNIPERHFSDFFTSVYQLHKQSFPDDLGSLLPLLSRRTYKEVFVEIPNLLSSLSWFSPALKQRVKEILSIDFSSEPLCFIHTDLHPGNMFLSKNQIYIIDFDEAVLGNPMRDVAKLTLFYYYRQFIGRQKPDNQFIHSILKHYERICASARDWFYFYLLFFALVYSKQFSVLIKPALRTKLFEEIFL